MLDKYHIEDTITKFKGYYSQIITEKDYYYLTIGAIIAAKQVFYKASYLELYIYLLEYSLTWFDSLDEYMTDDAPISLAQISLMIDKGDELIKSIIQLPLNN